MSLVKKVRNFFFPDTPTENSSRSTLLFAIFLIAIILPIRIFIAKPFIVSGTSMYPTFNTWHYLIIDQITYRLHEPQRGDVIVFKYPRDPSRFFIKRVIGLPGETVVLDGNTTTIKNTAHPDGLVLNESYVSPQYSKKDYMTVSLGDTEYFVMGDNRSSSADSRYWGALDKSKIVGRAFIRLFPVTEVGIFPGATNYQLTTNN